MVQGNHKQEERLKPATKLCINGFNQFRLRINSIQLPEFELQNDKYFQRNRLDKTLILHLPYFWTT